MPIKYPLFKMHQKIKKSLYIIRTVYKMYLSTLRPFWNDIVSTIVIHEHLLPPSQGFHRYSTDNDWHVPHFEKMLYDQAQLVSAYVDAYQVGYISKR